MSVLLRSVVGVLALAASGLLLRAAIVRLMSGVALLVGASIVLVTGALFLGSVAWALVQRWRVRRREGPSP